MAIGRPNGCKAPCEFRERVYAIIHRVPFVVSQLDLLPHTMEVDFPFLQ